MSVHLPRLARQVFSDLTPDVTPSGWATIAMLRSIRQVVCLMMAGCQTVLVITTVTALGPAGSPLAAGQAVVGIAALIALQYQRIGSILPFAMVALGLWGYLASADIESLTVFAASWQINLGSCAAALLILRPVVVPCVIAAGVTVGAAVAIAFPDWGVSTSISIAVTQTLIVVAVRLGLPPLLRTASATDDAFADAEAARTEAAVAHGVTAQTAEQARVLHDTAINTLAAVATGGAGARDEARVRRQCARDVALLESLRAASPEHRAQSLSDVFTVPGLPIRRSGIDDRALTDATDDLPPSVIAAAVGCVHECVMNATKHSGADAVSIDISVVDGTVVITVSDDGVGFDPAHTPERGISTSIRQRAADNGIGVELTSAVGVGTRIVLTLGMSGDSGDGGDVGDTLATSTHRLHRGAGLLWGTGVAAVGTVLLLMGGRNTGLALVPMLVLMFLAVILVRVRVLARTPRTLAVILAAITLTVFTLSGAAVEFGRSGAMHWQALAATGPFALFLSLRLSARGIIAGIAAWAVAIAGIAVTVWTATPVAGQITLVAGAVGIGFAAVWLRFRAAAEQYAADAARLQREASASRLEAELDLAMRQMYRRWSEAGLDSATDLLRAIADGARSPSDPTLRAACADEEQYLRQLLQVSPALMLLGARLLPSLRIARDRGVHFTLRVGDVDAPDVRTAEQISGTVNWVVANTSPGAVCSASIFPIGDDLQLTVIAPAAPPTVSSSVAERRVVTAGTLTITEYVFTAVATGERETAALTSGSIR